MGKMMGYMETAVLLQQYNIPLPSFRLVQTVAEAFAAAESLGFPVALKAVSPDLSHKSDRGLVKLGLDTAVAVEKAAKALMEIGDWRLADDNLQSPISNLPLLEGLLVQKMSPPGVEMIVGIHHDPQFGPVAALGSGGVLVELLDDAVLRLPPLTHQQAKGMIAASKSYRLLQGYRHYPPADMPALAELLVNISRLAAAEDGRIASLDLNPVIVLPEGRGVGAVDVRLEIRDCETQ